MLNTSQEAEQYLRDNLTEIVALLQLHVDTSALTIMMQVKREAAGHRAWSFVLIGVDELQHQAVLWIADTKDLYVTLHTASYGLDIEDWLELAKKRLSGRTTSAQSRDFLIKLRQNDSFVKAPAFEPILDDPAHCPACGKAAEEELGVPDTVPYACEDCQQRTADKHGNRVEYYNTHMSGGLRAVYADGKDFYINDQGGFNAICYINGRPFHTQMNRFGGFIFTPIYLG